MARQAKPIQKTNIKVPNGFVLPPKTQWGYTPPLWDSSAHEIFGNILTGTELAKHVTLHHDGVGSNFAIRPPAEGIGLDFEFEQFSGSFMSIAFGFPEKAAKSIGRHDLLRISVISSADKSFQAYARLNLRHGPNNEQIIRMIDIGDGESFAEFDIFYTEFEPNRASDAWIDLIINNPANCKFSLSDVVILRRVRASL